MVDHPKNPRSRTCCLSTNSPTSPTFQFWKVRFKTEVCASSGSPSEAMLWFKEVKILDTIDDLKSSRSVQEHRFPNFEMLDVKIASALNEIIRNSHFRERVSVEEPRARTQDRFLRGRQMAFMIYEYFRVTGVHDTVLDYADLFALTLQNDVQESDTRWDEILLSMDKNYNR